MAVFVHSATVRAFEKKFGTFDIGVNIALAAPVAAKAVGKLAK